jgi:hypothetical protein
MKFIVTALVITTGKKDALSGPDINWERGKFPQALLRPDTSNLETLRPKRCCGIWALYSLLFLRLFLSYVVTMKKIVL